MPEMLESVPLIWNCNDVRPLAAAWSEEDFPPMEPWDDGIRDEGIPAAVIQAAAAPDYDMYRRRFDCVRS